MHCVTLADLAATLAQHGPSLLAVRSELTAQTIMRYWTASRSRHELWHRAMGRFREAKNRGDFMTLHHWWTEHAPVLEDVFVSELLSRVVAAIATEAVRRTESPGECDENLSAIAHGVFVAQLEASNRVSEILLDGGGARTRDIVSLNRLRYGVDRWSDWLVARISLHPSRCFDYAIDVERCKTFNEEVRETATGEHRDMTTWLMNAAMRDMLVRRTSDAAGLPNANYEVASAALGLFRPELFDDYGVPKSLWLHRLQREAAKMKPFDFAGTRI